MEEEWGHAYSIGQDTLLEVTGGRESDHQGHGEHPGDI